MTRYWMALLLGSVLGAPSAAAAQDLPSSVGAAVPSIVTIGEAVVRRAPDVAFVTAAVETRARAPRDAQQQNASTMTMMLRRLESSGLSKDAIRTLGYSIQQEVDVVNGRRVPREYVARNAVEVRVEPIDRAGELIDLLVQAGATAVDRVRFDLKDRQAAEHEALRLAVVDARGRAEAAAAGAGRAVDRVLRVDDRRQPEYRPALMASSRAVDASTPIEPGVLEIQAGVTLTVSIK